MSNVNNNIVDIDISTKKKKRVRFDGDDNRAVELDTTDMNVVTRLNESIPKIDEITRDAADITAGLDVDKEDTMTYVSIVSEKMKEADSKIRGIIDYIFGAPVCDAAVPYGTMFDVIEDTYMYDYLMGALIKLYETSIVEGYNKIINRMESHTKKYTKKR